MDLPTFRERTLDFKSTDPGVVSGMLAAAAAELDAGVWGKLYDEGVFWLTQWKLSKSEFGKATRRKGDKTPNSYQEEFERLQLIVSSGAMMVSGGPSLIGPVGGSFRP